MLYCGDSRLELGVICCSGIRRVWFNRDLLQTHGGHGILRQIGVWCVKISVNMNRCVNYLCKKKENHAREMMCKNK